MTIDRSKFINAGIRYIYELDEYEVSTYSSSGFSGGLHTDITSHRNNCRSVVYSFCENGRLSAVS